jgi:hypothetical protein
LVYYLPSKNSADGEQGDQGKDGARVAVVEMADLRVFWGSEICRIEYLMHLMETGRIHDEDKETI